MSALFPNQATKERRKIEELEEKAVSEPPLRESSVRVVPIEDDEIMPLPLSTEMPPPFEIPAELPDFVDHETPMSPRTKRLVAIMCAALSLPLIAWAGSSGENMETAGRYLRYAVMGQKPGGTLTIESMPSGAHVFLDGEDTGKKTPIVIASLESEVVHKVRLELAGEEPQTSTVSIGAAERRTVSIIIASAMVDLRVKSDPDRADVTVNGRPIAFTPCSAPVRVGHPMTLRVSKVGYKDYEESIVPVRGKPLDLIIKMEKTEELLAAEAEEAEIRAELEKPKPKPKAKRAKKSSSRRSRRKDT
jgi:hypothetical protein